MKYKILTWIDLYLLHYCLAYNLQSKIEADFFAIVDVPNNPKKFFQEQNLVNFKKLWFYHDYINIYNKVPDISYLSEFEKKYHIDLWKLAINERLFYRFNRFYNFKTNEILTILEQECKLFEKVLEETKPDFLMINTPQFHHKQLLYDLCRKKDIKILGIHITRIGKKSIICEDEKTFNLTTDLKCVVGKNRTLEELKKYRESLNYTQTVNNYISGRKSRVSDQIKALINFIIISDTRNIKTHYSYYGRNKLKVIIDAIVFLLKRKIRELFMETKLEKNIDLTKKFVYFPLSLDEEFNLLIHAPFYTNQIEVIRHVAKSLPIEYTLYVKEHPVGAIRGWRPISEYKEILKIPNVHLIHYSFPSEKLYQHCSLVFTIRGTSSFDATFYQKPSIVLGDMPHNIIPSVHRLKSIDDLPELIRSSIKEYVDPTYLDKFLVLMEQNSFDFDMLGFENQRSQFFYAGGILSDVKISTSKIKEFLKQNEKEFNLLASEHIKKITLYESKIYS